MEETREALVQKLLDIYSKEGNYETSVPGVWFIALNVTRFLNRIFINL